VNYDWSLFLVRVINQCCYCRGGGASKNEWARKVVETASGANRDFESARKKFVSRASENIFCDHGPSVRLVCTDPQHSVSFLMLA